MRVERGPALAEELFPKAAPGAARTAATAAAVGVAYLAAARFGLTLAFAAEQVTVVWPPTGIALASLLLLGRAAVPGIWAGALAANLAIGVPSATALGIATGNTLEAVTAVRLLRGVGFDGALERLRDVLALLALAAVAAPVVSATVGVTALCLTGVHPWTTFGVLWRMWWLGDAMGVLLAGPVLLTWMHPQWVAWTRRLELVVLFAGLGTVSLLVFTDRLGALPSAPHLVYAVFPFVIWCALRFGQRETATALLLIEVLAVLGAVSGRGPFTGNVQERLILLQLFMAVTASTALLLGAAMAERVRAEAERARVMAELKAALQAKDEFLAVLGHELRNPLAPLRNAAEILAARAGGDPAIERIQKIVDRQVRHMVRLVDDLLDVSRIARGRVELRREAVALGEVASRAAEAVRALVAERGHTLAVHVPAPPVVVEGDPVRLEQVLTNLLHNAARYTEPGGHITLRVAREGAEVVARVRDDGIGIAPGMIGRVFDIFVQGDRPSGGATGGLGLGLTLVKNLVELHGGTVRAHSDGPGRGSEFTVRLPALEVSAVPGLLAAARPKAPVPPRRVLVVDDNVDAAESLAIVLRQAGHEVVTAHDGARGLAASAEGRFDVVFLDIALPDGLDGYEVARRMRRDPRLRGLILVALTGFGQHEDRRRALEAGFDHHLVKPVDPEAVKEVLAAAG